MTRRWAVGSIALVATLTVAVALLIVAMALYPGGTALDPHQPGHSFWFNFLCDLTTPVALNGAPNRLGAMVGQAAMAALATALGIFWLTLPLLFQRRRLLSAFIRAAGGASTLGFAVVPFASGPLHAMAVFTAVIPALVAGVLGIVGLLWDVGSRGLVTVAVGTLAASLIDAVLYARSFAAHPRVVSPALPAGQRIAVLLMLTWMAATAAVLVRRSRVSDQGAVSPRSLR
jgi:hypothetical protein